MATAVAPRARALITSAPERTPEANSTGMPAAGSPTAGRAAKGGHAAGGRAAAVGGAVDPVHAAVPGAAGVVGVADALDQQGQRSERAEPGQVVPGERVAEEARERAHNRRGGIGGGRSHHGAGSRAT